MELMGLTLNYPPPRTPLTIFSLWRLRLVPLLYGGNIHQTTNVEAQRQFGCEGFG